LKKGKVKLYKTDASGKEMVFAILKDKECFGSLTPIEGTTINEFAEAMEDVLTCLIDKKFFFSFIEDKPNLVLRLNKLLSLKIYELEVMLEELTFKTVTERAVSLFLKLNEKFGVSYQGSDMINIPLTHNDIASMIGSTRESTTLALNKLKSRGLIGSMKKRIIINDLQKLASFSEH
jgi:CRP/FNR family transcriptional regulator